MSSHGNSSALQRKIALRRCLRQLSILTGRTVGAGELGAPEEACMVREVIGGSLASPQIAFEVPFADKHRESFLEYLRGITRGNASAIHIWTPDTIVCGILTVPSLLSLRWDFPFDINPEGILSFVASDLRDRLVVDFFYGDEHEERLRLEVFGDRWSRVPYVRMNSPGISGKGVSRD